VETLYFSQVISVLELRDLQQHYPGHRALNGVSLEIPQGGFYSLLGPSGCGKTTTLRLIAGFEQPTAGQILLDGVDVSGVPPHKRNVNTVFQSRSASPSSTSRTTRKRR
jgi:spermidine/putrescine transport system ATP-binding protein